MNREKRSTVRVALYGVGQLGASIARLIEHRPDVHLVRQGSRANREAVLGSGADVVVITTTSFLSDVAPDIETAVSAGSNVITSAEEAAFPWAVDSAIADKLDALAQEQGTSILGAGLNPGFAFDALVLTASGAAAHVSSVRVERVVDCSGFGSSVLRRVGFGYGAREFEEGVKSGAITGHIGFPQSMNVVAAALGKTIERIDRHIDPIFADHSYEVAHASVSPGETAGFNQHYAAYVDGQRWFDALFTAHLVPSDIGKEPRDEVWLRGEPDLHLSVVPGLNPQSSSGALIANSLHRVVGARAGWLTVAELPPALPC